jgi:hypothetical protein
MRDWSVRRALAAAPLVFLPTLLVGWQLGYHSLNAYILFWTYVALLGVTARRIVRHLFPGQPVADSLIRIGVVAFATVVAGGLVLGSVGVLTPQTCLAFAVGVCLLSLFLKSPPLPDQLPSLTFVPRWVGAIAAALVAFAIGYAMTHAPLTLYDSVSYHLFFSARWLQDHRLSIIPTPFSDEAQAYAPANGELFFLWLMLPFHGDLVARAGQLPFGLLCAVALFALARRLGAKPEHAIYPGVLFLLSRPILEQIVGANVDLVCAAMFLTSLYLGILAVDRDERRDWALWGVSLGLYGGSKYVALVYTPVFLLLAVARGPRAKVLWAIPGIAAFALPWYLRNWLAGGSPIYPATLKIAGLTLAQGAFSRDAMLNTIFHTSDLRLFPAMAARAFGPTLLLLWIPFALAGTWSMIRRGWWPNGFVALVVMLMVPLYWFGFPVNIDSRFLMPAIGPALLPCAFAFTSHRTWNAGVDRAYLLGMLWMLVGLHAEIPARSLPWFMSGWLALNGLLKSDFIIWFAFVTLIMAVVWWIASRTARWGLPVVALSVAVTATVLALGANRWCQPSTCDYLDTTSPFIRPELLASWQWVDEHVKQSTVAYTGINLPYPLTGQQLTNRVIYVNIDGHPRWRFHDYDRAYRAGQFTPTPPLLSTSSGELRGVIDRSGPRDDAVRPRYERLEGDQAAWIGNLQVLGVRHLFVSTLSAYEIDYVWHNEGGFPIEDEWAKMDPQSFQLVYENPDVRIYQVDFHRRNRV